MDSDILKMGMWLLGGEEIWLPWVLAAGMRPSSLQGWIHGVPREAKFHSLPLLFGVLQIIVMLPFS